MITSFLLLAATYVNPVLHADFSDPDVCMGADGKAYLTASSFGGLPGLPILSSEDFVNWEYVAYALESHPFESNGPEHGNAVWAPTIRYRADRKEYVIYWGDPDRGAYRVAAKSPKGPWSEPRLVVSAKGMIDVCPLYDDDGRVYLVNAWANSRAGMNSVLTVRELDTDEARVISGPVMVYDGVPQGNFTTEGPKFYKKDGEYWLWFPAGGVGVGWQVAARAKSPYGPYETKTVLAQGKTEMNGPHQGAVVCGRDGKWHFLHFTDRDAYGRVVCLEPMTWGRNEWPVVGNDGEPVMSGEFDVISHNGQLPFGGLRVYDEFDGKALGLQWQFLGRSSDLAAWPTPYGYFRLYSTEMRIGKNGVRNLWDTPNLMVQKFPAAEFTVVLKSNVGAKQTGEESGLIVQGRSYARIGLRYDVSGSDGAEDFKVVYTECTGADRGNGESVPLVLGTVPAKVIGAGLRPARTADIYFRLTVKRAAEKSSEDELHNPPLCSFAWSTDNLVWHDCGKIFKAVQGKWIGATFGVYSISEPGCKDRGWIDLDWLR